MGDVMVVEDSPMVESVPVALADCWAGGFRGREGRKSMAPARAIPDLAQNVELGPKSFGSMFLCGFSVIMLQETAEHRLA